MTTREREWEVLPKLRTEDLRRKGKEKKGDMKAGGIQRLKKESIMQAAKQQYYETVFLQLWPWATA